MRNTRSKAVIKRMGNRWVVFSPYFGVILFDSTRWENAINYADAFMRDHTEVPC